MVARPLLLAGLLAVCGPCLHGATKWLPLDPADQTARPPASDPLANGLVLLREISVDASSLEGTEFEYTFRAKVFTAAGVEALNKTEIPFERNLAPKALAARVVKPDGRIVEVSPQAFFTREVVRVGRESISVKAFSYASLEPGDIAEYRFRVHNPELVLGRWFYLDDVFPTATVRIRIGAISYPGLGLQALWSNSAPFQIVEDPKSHEHIYEARGLPSTISEPFAPPDDLVKPWFLFYYTFLKGSAQDYWEHVGEDLQELTKAHLTPKKRLTETATTLLAGASGEEESVRRLYEFCRTRIKNLSYECSGYTPDQIEKLKPNMTAVDTLANGYGTAADINLLFGALLRASGRNCHLAYCGDRSLSFFNQKLKTSSALPHLLIATNSDGWKFYDPGSRYLPAGSLNWKHEATTALVGATKQGQFVETPRSNASYSTTRRTANFTLTADGTLEGDLAVELTGHGGFLARHRYGPKTAGERADIVAQEVVPHLGQAEVSNCSVDLAEDPAAPLRIACHVKIPDYATSAGGRLLLPFAFFQRGVPETFAAAERKFGIYFPYHSREEDKIAITLPGGYELETPGVLQESGDGDKLHYSPCLSLEDQGRRVVYERTLVLRLFHLPADNYPVLRDLFHQVAEQDNRLFSLVSSNPAPAPDPAQPEVALP